jgi:flagellar motor switch protein FliM
MDQAEVSASSTGSASDTAADAEELKRLELTQIFQNTLAPIVELPALLAIFAESAEGGAAALKDVFGLDAALVFQQAVQQPVGEALAPCVGRIAAVYAIAEWGARAVVAFDRLVLFRALDTMYGGDGKFSGPAPARDLTGLEKSVAGQLAKVVITEIQSRLAPFVAFDCVLETVAEEFDAALFEKDRYDFISVQMRLGDLDEWVIVTLPARGIELARDLMAAPSEETPVELDPNWSRTLEHNVGRTEIDLIAVAAGPPMLLGEVARLQPGSLVEFDADRLEYVQIESDGEAIFEGKLGQTKGFLSICIETPLSANAADEAAQSGARSRPRA